MFLPIDRSSPTPLCRQIYEDLRRRILTGVLPAGCRLPASRQLARELGVARNVVLEAYDLLAAEGFTAAAQGSGTFVAAGASRPPLPAAPRPPGVAAVNMGYQAPAGVINFRSGTPDLARFPVRVWARLLAQAFLAGGPEALGYGDPEGRRELRLAIRDDLARERGVRCHPDQIVVTAGTTQAIGIAGGLLLQDRRQVILEDPITRDIAAILRQRGAEILPVPVDSQGLITDRLPGGVAPALVYVTPSHQYPTGTTLPIQRRLDLLRYAAATGALVIEDDYDSELRFDGPPLSSLHGLDPERVVYIGTFSKTLCPAIRTGYLVLPPGLVSQAREAKWLSDLHNSTVAQLALAAFIRDGHYRRHLGRMKRLYQRRRAATVAALRDQFGARAQVLGSATGLHLAARFPGRVFDQGLLAAVEAQGARFYPAAVHAIATRDYDDTLVIGYGNLEEEAIRKGVGLLKAVMGGSLARPR
ncbi:MAG: PLP-dependent aminotransferase family protein [Thermodesulfobacteriota bacterium]